MDEFLIVSQDIKSSCEPARPGPRAREQVRWRRGAGTWAALAALAALGRDDVPLFWEKAQQRNCNTMAQLRTQMAWATSESESSYPCKKLKKHQMAWIRRQIGLWEHKNTFFGMGLRWLRQERFSLHPKASKNAGGAQQNHASSLIASKTHGWRCKAMAFWGLLAASSCSGALYDSVLICSCGKHRSICHALPSTATKPVGLHQHQSQALLRTGSRCRFWFIALTALPKSMLCMLPSKGTIGPN